MMTTYTPMMQQYLTIKEEYKDAFLFFRLGDFYELFFEDAKRASQILEITLTSRDAGAKERVPMCGVPHHSAKNYIETLVQKGYKVAICEQTEDPKQAKGVVKREVVQLITPGTLTEGKTIDGKTNHYIASATFIDSSNFSFAYLDVTTGEGKAQLLEGNSQDLIKQLQSLQIKEVIISSDCYDELLELAQPYHIVLSIENEEMDEIVARPYVQEVPAAAQSTIKKLLAYIERTQMRSLAHIQPFHFIETKAYLRIDTNSKRNLELIQSIRGGDHKGTLLWLLDETVTAMGGRKLKQWLHQPLATRSLIEKRLSIVEQLLAQFFLREELREHLKNVYDLERLVGRVAFGNVNGRDLAQLRESLRQIPSIKEKLLNSEGDVLQNLGQVLDEVAEVRELLERAITDHPPLTLKEGDVIRDGFDAKLDELRDASRNGKSWILELEQRERNVTGIPNLKVGYNRVFGYYIEVTKSHISKADLTRYERKQTLANAERYITQELKEKESLILNAEEESLALEYDLFVAIREELKPFIPRLQQLASAISELDVYMSFAVVTDKYQFTKPQFHDGTALSIIEGRHPVVEKMLNKQMYVPNDCVLDETNNMMLITGPNMSGKSTYMRQVALIVVMAQIGCYVPAKEAILPITDQIFTRIGAADDLVAGQSTFMVEMLESQHAITHATSRSLLLFDEIGRGTSTYDGMSLAQAMMEYIHDFIGANTLFSTHYHELTQLEGELARLQNVHVSATERDGRVVFLHKVKKGAADKSYGVHVAQLAEMPEEIIQRAQVLLAQFEASNHAYDQKETKLTNIQQLAQTEEKDASTQLSLFNELSEGELAVIETLKKSNVLGMTPMEAMNKLYELQQLLNK